MLSEARGRGGVDGDGGGKSRPRLVEGVIGGEVVAGGDPDSGLAGAGTLHGVDAPLFELGPGSAAFIRGAAGFERRTESGVVLREAAASAISAFISTLGACDGFQTGVAETVSDTAGGGSTISSLSISKMSSMAAAATVGQVVVNVVFELRRLASSSGDDGVLRFVEGMMGSGKSCIASQSACFSNAPIASTLRRTVGLFCS
ncbi:unnamed protein product [Mycena citricolor]|uniref:Uncharacterized protein n=1 Tax=Mycena citricolor TaxID=2018698 RepID=A0AAD2GX87_9AGAR|nr:unnamed protein product [Mycena citricolor]